MRVQAGIFLVDVFCLGAKLAHYEDCDGDDYRRAFLPPRPPGNRRQARRIVSHLQQHCGSGNFEYLVMLGEAGNIDRFFEK